MKMRLDQIKGRSMTAVVFLLMLLSGANAPLHADVRIIVGFDAQGPRLMKVVEASATLPKLVGQHARTKQSFEGIAPVLVNWFDAAGRLLVTERVEDPRVAHYPGGLDESSQSRAGGRVALASGALLLRGPDSAQRVDIELPASEFPLLASASWSFDLNSAEGRSGQR